MCIRDRAHLNRITPPKARPSFGWTLLALTTATSSRRPADSTACDAQCARCQELSFLPRGVLLLHVGQPRVRGGLRMLSVFGGQVVCEDVLFAGDRSQSNTGHAVKCCGHAIFGITGRDCFVSFAPGPGPSSSPKIQHHRLRPSNTLQWLSLIHI